MSLHQLPAEIYSAIFALVADNSSWKDGLRLRYVCRSFDREIQTQYFDKKMVHTSIDEDTNLTTWRMGNQHLYRYLKGQIGSRQPINTLTANLKEAVEILLSVPTFQLTSRCQTTRTQIVNGIIRVEAGDSLCQATSMVTLSVLDFLGHNNRPSFERLSQLTRDHCQIQPLSWALVTAIFMKDTTTIEAIVEYESNFIARKQLFADPLRVVVRDRQYALVRYLLEHGASVNTAPRFSPSLSCYQMPIKQPCICGDIQMVELMLEPQYSLHFDVQGLRLLLSTVVRELAADPRLRLVDASIHLSIIQVLLLTVLPSEQRSFQHFMVRLAIRYSITELIPMVMEMGYDLNETQNDRLTDLCFAAGIGAPHIVQVLLQYGARQSHTRGHDAVRAACVAGRPYVLDVLLSHGTTIDQYGHALAAGHFLIVAKAICHGADDTEYMQVLDCLFQHGLDLNAANCGVKALRYAMDIKNDALVANLLAKGVNLPKQ